MYELFSRTALAVERYREPLLLSGMIYASQRSSSALTSRATHSLTHKVSVDADLVSFDAALVDVGRRVGSEYAVIPAVTDVQHLRCASLRGLRALFHRAAAGSSADNTR